jgi:hypothetical protein
MMIELAMTTLFSMLVGYLFVEAFKSCQYPRDDRISDLFMLIARQPDAKIVPLRGLIGGTVYEVRIETPLGTLQFWNANRWYAWAHEGSFISATGEANMLWKDAMPNRRAIRAMRKLTSDWDFSKAIFTGDDVKVVDGRLEVVRWDGA